MISRTRLFLVATFALVAPITAQVWEPIRADYTNVRGANFIPTYASLTTNPPPDFDDCATSFATWIFYDPSGTTANDVDQQLGYLSGIGVNTVRIWPNLTGSPLSALLIGAEAPAIPLILIGNTIPGAALCVMPWFTINTTGGTTSSWNFQVPNLARWCGGSLSVQWHDYSGTGAGSVKQGRHELRRTLHARELARGRR